jgi:hypothetical protein
MLRTPERYDKRLKKKQEEGGHTASQQAMPQQSRENKATTCSG